MSDGLPYDAAADKVDPLSRYVNDDDILQLEDNIALVQLRRGDLPHGDDADKIDPVSRYVNDDDIVQLREEALIQIGSPSVSDGLPYDKDADKVDPVSRYVNDDDI